MADILRAPISKARSLCCASRKKLVDTVHEPLHRLTNCLINFLIIFTFVSDLFRVILSALRVYFEFYGKLKSICKHEFLFDQNKLVSEVERFGSHLLPTSDFDAHRLARD